jgi:hypothetical protein
LLTSRAWRIDIPERQLFQRAQLQLVRAFLATDDLNVFNHKPRSQLTLYQGDPYGPQPAYEAQWEVEYLRNPLIRSILPACARSPIEVKVNPEATRGFITNGVHLARKEPPAEASWGTWTSLGPAQAASFESLPVRPSGFPYLEIPVAGNLGGNTNLSLELVELATGKRIPVGPGMPPGGEWFNCYVRAPAGEFKIVAREVNGAGWFGFKAPREVGRLSFWAVQTLRAWWYVLVTGLALFVFNLVTVVALARQTR